MTIVHSSSTGITTSIASLQATIVTSAFAVVQDELVLVTFRWEGVDNDPVTITVADTGGNSWTVAGYANGTSAEDQKVCLAWCIATSTESITVTASFAGGVTRTYRAWSASRFTVDNTITVSDVAASATNLNAGTWSSGTVTALTGNLIFDICANFQNATAVGTPADYTVAYDSGGFTTFYRIAPSDGDYIASAAMTPSDTSAVLSVVFSEPSPPAITVVDTDDIITQGQQNISITVANIPTGNVPIRAGAGGTSGVGGTDFTGFVVTPGGTAGSFTIEADVPLGIATGSSVECYVEYAPE